MTDTAIEAKPDPESLMLGYLFKIRTPGTKTDLHTIFVNPKGYYQIPSDLEVASLQFYQEDTFQLDYFLQYQLGYDTATLPTKTEKVKDVVGQHAGVFYPGRHMGDEIRGKYSLSVYQNNKLKSEESMTSWTGIGFDVTPYAVLYILQEGDSEFQKRVVGRTGVYNLLPKFAMYDFYFAGRRMTLAEEDNRPYLDE